MPLPRITRTATFRLAVVFAGLFVLGAAVLVVFFDLTVADYARRSLRSDVQDELQLLERAPSSRDAQGIAQLVLERQRILGSHEFYYLVFGPDGRRLAGDLPSAAAQSGWSTAKVPAPQESREYDGEIAEVRTLGVVIPGGGLLVVGRSTYEVHELREAMVTGTLAAAGLIALMALVTAVLIGRQFLQRVDDVSAAAARIMEGRLDQRLPTIGMGDEFDRLGASLNAMLDRMQGLMEGLRQVSSDIAHDLRTPLMRLRRRLEEAQKAAADEDGRQALAVALDQLDEILATFGALLRIAQVEGGSGREAFESVNLSEVIDRVRQAYEPAAEDVGKILVARIAPDIWVAGDEELLAQLASNLIENGFTHAAGAPTVELELRVEGSRAMLSVADSGPGVPTAERERVLRRFYRLDRSRTTPGAGLGLSMVQAIVQLHDGDLELDDNGPGLVVRVSLPRRAED